MIGAAAGVAAVLIAIAVSLHHHNKEKRAYPVMAAVTLLLTVATGFAVVAFTPDLGAVWAYTGDGPGLVVLLIAMAGSGITYYHHLRHRKHFHTHGTPAIGVVLAVAGALAVLNIRHVSGHALGAVAGSWRGAGSAFSQVNTGKAAKAVPATVTTGSHGIVLAVAIIGGLLLLVKVVRGFGDRKKPASSRPSAAAMRELGK